MKSLLQRPPSVCLFEASVLLTCWLNNEYSDVTFNVLDNLATDVIIGEKIFKENESVTFTFEGHRPPLTLNALMKMSIPFPKPFSHLSENCRPVAQTSRENILRLISILFVMKLSVCYRMI